MIIITYKLLWDFNIQTDHLISARRLNPIVINKKMRTGKILDFTVTADHRIKLKEREKKDKYLNLARELKKNMEHAGENYTNRNWCIWITKGTGRLGIWHTSWDHPNYYIIENDQNTETWGDLLSLKLQ